jgi:hypothetical protein
MGSTFTSTAFAGVIPCSTSAFTAAALTPPVSSKRRNASSTATSLSRAANCKISRYSRSARPGTVAAKAS